MRILIITTLLMLFTTYADAQLQPPAPSTGVVSGSQQKKTPDYYNRANTEQCGTIKAPLIVDIVKTAEDKKNTNDATKYTEEGAAINRKSLIANRILAIVAALTLIAISYQSWQTRRSVDAVIIGQRPYVFLGNTEFPKGKNGFFSYPDITKNPPITDYHFINHGQSPAIILKGRVELYLGKELPHFRKFSYSSINEGDAILAKESKSVT